MPDPFVEELEQRARKAFKELNLEYTPSARVYLQKQSSLEFVRVSHETFANAVNELGNTYYLNVICVRKDNWEDPEEAPAFDVHFGNVFGDTLAQANLVYHNDYGTLLLPTNVYSCFQAMHEGSKFCPVCGEDWSHDYMTLTKEQCVDAGKHMKCVDNEGCCDYCGQK